MGLDMDLYVSTNGKTIEEMGADIGKAFDSGEFNSFAYWRKHNALHGFFEDEWVKMGNHIDDFNCAYMPVTLEMLDALEQHVINGTLTQRSGFFWGDDDASGYYREHDLEAIKNAREHIEAGNPVYYHPWW